MRSLPFAMIKYLLLLLLLLILTQLKADVYYGPLPASSSGASVSFQTISTPNGSNPVADVASDTLILTSSDSSISITGTAGTDTIDLVFSGSTGITSLNTLTGAAQTLVPGTGGTDFAINSSGTTHTFNIPTSSAVNRGALSSADWSTFNNKVGSLGGTTGSSLTLSIGTAGTDVNRIVAPSSITLNIPNSSSSIRGALTPTDWNTFNNKQDTITVSDTASIDLTKSVSNVSAVVLPAGVDHNSLANLLVADPHTQYFYLPGRTTGTVATGGTASGGSLILRSTSNATKGQILIDETTDSTSTTTGAIAISGGIGIAKNTYLGSSLILQSGTLASEIHFNEPSGSGTNYTGFKAQAQVRDVNYTLPNADGTSGQVLSTNGAGGLSWATDANTGVTAHSALTGLNADDHAQYFLLAGRSTGTVGTGSTASGGSLILRSTSNASKGQVIFDETTDSSSSSTGAIKIDGGVGIAKNLYVGSSVSVTGAITADALTGVLRGINGVITGNTAHSVLNGLTADDHTNYFYLPGRSTGTVATGSTASGGSLILRSTSNVTKGQILIDEVTDSSSTTTGALAISGGVGIAKNLYTGASLFVGGSSQFQVSNVGDLVKVKNLNYNWPTSHNSTNSFLRNDGGGSLTWTQASQNIISISSNVSLSINTIHLVSTAAARSLTLPNPATTTGAITIKDSTGQCGTNNITIVRFGSEQIEGTAASLVLAADWGAWTFITNGTNWFLL